MLMHPPITREKAIELINEVLATQEIKFIEPLIKKLFEAEVLDSPGAIAGYYHGYTLALMQSFAIRHHELIYPEDRETKL